MGFDSNAGVAKLGAVLQERMKTVNGKTPLLIDFGVIQSDYSLKTNTFAKAISKSDYSVCRQLTLGETGTELTSTLSDGKHGGHQGGDGSHSHTIRVPEKMRGLKPGDRVLVVWVMNEAVVVDIVKRI